MVLPFVMLIFWVKTPTFDALDPVMLPAKTGELTGLLMSVKFWPGCANNKLFPEPVASKKLSNCQRLLGDAVKLDSAQSTIPAPIPSLLMGIDCRPSE